MIRPVHSPSRLVAQHLEHAQHERAGTDLEEGRVLTHVGVAHDHVQAAVLLGVGVGLVTGVDDRPGPGRGRRDALPDVLGALRHGELGAACGREDLAGAGVDLPAHQERHQHRGVVLQVVVTAGQVVLVAAVAVAGRVGVVAEQVDVATDALLGEPLLGGLDQAAQDPLPRLVVGHQLGDRVALRGGVLGVRTDVEVQPRTVGQEDVRGAAPRHDLPEQVAGDLVGAEPPLAAERAGDPVLGLEPVDPPLHRRNLTRSAEE